MIYTDKNWKPPVTYCKPNKEVVDFNNMISGGGRIRNLPCRDIAKDATPTDDTISRQAAIDAVERALFKRVAKAFIESLPPVNPKPVCEDCIDRYAVLAELDPQSYEYKVVKELPSVEPKQSEIIRCKNCRHDNNCEIQYAAEAGSKFFCGAAERKNECPPVEPKRPKRTKTMMIDGEPTEIDPLSYEVGYSHGQTERPKGEWIRNDNGTYSCSFCHSWIPEKQHHYARFCLYCGADMKGADDETD